MKTIQTYAEFWPYYLQEHAKPATRGWHYLGTGLALFLLVSLLATQRWALIPLVFVCGYFFAWVSHGLIEKNKPATFTHRKPMVPQGRKSRDLPRHPVECGQRLSRVNPQDDKSGL